MRKTRHKITFTSFNDSQAVALAKFGMSTKLIMRETGLTECQVSYRLNKAKRLEEYAHGYRVQWRNGESDVWKNVGKDLLSVIRKDIQRSLPIQIDHPEPQVSNHKVS